MSNDSHIDDTLTELFGPPVKSQEAMKAMFGEPLSDEDLARIKDASIYPGLYAKKEEPQATDGPIRTCYYWPKDLSRPIPEGFEFLGTHRGEQKWFRVIKSWITREKLFMCDLQEIFTVPNIAIVGERVDDET